MGRGTFLEPREVTLTLTLTIPPRTVARIPAVRLRAPRSKRRTSRSPLGAASAATVPFQVIGLAVAAVAGLLGTAYWSTQDSTQEEILGYRPEEDIASEETDRSANLDSRTCADLDWCDGFDASDSPLDDLAYSDNMPWKAWNRVYVNLDILNRRPKRKQRRQGEKVPGQVLILVRRLKGAKGRLSRFWVAVDSSRRVQVVHLGSRRAFRARPGEDVKLDKVPKLSTSERLRVESASANLARRHEGAGNGGAEMKTESSSKAKAKSDYFDFLQTNDAWKGIEKVCSVAGVCFAWSKPGVLGAGAMLAWRIMSWADVWGKAEAVHDTPVATLDAVEAAVSHWEARVARWDMLPTDIKLLFIFICSCLLSLLYA